MSSLLSLNLLRMMQLLLTVSSQSTILLHLVLYPPSNQTRLTVSLSTFMILANHGALSDVSVRRATMDPSVRGVVDAIGGSAELGGSG